MDNRSFMTLLRLQLMLFNVLKLRAIYGDEFGAEAESFLSSVNRLVMDELSKR